MRSGLRPEMCIPVKHYPSRALCRRMLPREAISTSRYVGYGIVGAVLAL